MLHSISSQRRLNHKWLVLLNNFWIRLSSAIAQQSLGYVPFIAVGAELLFEVPSQRYERGSALITSNLPFDEWT